jgi:hypothetical protein
MNEQISQGAKKSETVAAGFALARQDPIQGKHGLSDQFLRSRVNASAINPKIYSSLSD